nr:MAG: hypothetical protein DIU67_02180 [Actinomycetota bacterium]
MVVVGGAALAVAVFAWAWNRARSRPRRRIASTGLGAGVYLFTSAGCDQCARARELLTASLGEGGFTEIPWERQADVFDRLGIKAAPSTLVVKGDGSGVWYAGVPRRHQVAKTRNP